MNSVSHGPNFASSAPTYLIEPPPSRFFSVSRATVVSSLGGVGSPGHASPTGHGNSPTAGSAGHGTAALGPHGVRGPSAVLRALRALRCSRFSSISFLSLRFLAVSLTGVGSPAGHGDSPTGHGDSPATGHGTAPFGHDRAQTQPSESFCALGVCAWRAYDGTLRRVSTSTRVESFFMAPAQRCLNGAGTSKKNTNITLQKQNKQRIYQKNETYSSHFDSHKAKGTPMETQRFTSLRKNEFMDEETIDRHSSIHPQAGTPVHQLGSWDAP